MRFEWPALCYPRHWRAAARRRSTDRSTFSSPGRLPAAGFSFPQVVVQRRNKDRTLGIGSSEETFHLYRCLHTVPGVDLEAIVIACYRNFEFSDFHLRNEFWFDIRPANTHYESEKPASGRDIQRRHGQGKFLRGDTTRRVEIVPQKFAAGTCPALSCPEAGVHKGIFNYYSRCLKTKRDCCGCSQSLSARTDQRTSNCGIRERVFRSFRR